MSEGDDRKTLGIDLGTTNSGMAVYEGDEPQILQNNEGDPLTPSVVSFGDDDVEVGRRANNRAAARPERTKREIKLEMGDSEYAFEVDGESYSPTEISAEILQKLKRDAEDYLGETVTEAVITVPAYFNSDQKKATRQAGVESGFDDVQLTNEPTAAALAYGEEQQQPLRGTIMVFDFGGGTLDVSIIDVDTGASQPEYDVRVAEGNNELGGRNFDRALVEHFAESLPQDEADLLDDPEIEENLREAAEQAKIELSTSDETDVLVPYLGVVDGDQVELDETITRDTFEDLVAEELEEVREEVRQALEAADLERGDLDMVLLVGGSTYVPAVREAVEAETDVEPVRSRDPDQIVATGAAVYGEKAIVEGGGTGGTTGGKGTTGGIEVVENIPMALGTRLHDGSFDPIIPGNTKLKDARGTGYYTTVEDNQTLVTIDVFQGEDPVAENNTKLDEFQLTGIPPMPAREPQIEVVFYVDEDGVLQVEADELSSDAEGELEVQQDVTGTTDSEVADAAESEN
ncbi:MAG: Hsp70 family protein [Halobacteriaceae archaeon]